MTPAARKIPARRDRVGLGETVFLFGEVARAFGITWRRRALVDAHAQASGFGRADAARLSALR
jgi:hypothetical protein